MGISARVTSGAFDRTGTRPEPEDEYFTRRQPRAKGGRTKLTRTTRKISEGSRRWFMTSARSRAHGGALEHVCLGLGHVVAHERAGACRITGPDRAQ